jgi:hypothetical protein
MTTIAELTPDSARIREFLEAITEPGEPFEIRVLDARKGGPSNFCHKTNNGFFRDIETAVAAAAGITGDDAGGVYVTLNRLDPIVLNWGLNRLGPVTKATGDAQVSRLRHLLIDLDPQREKSVNTTEGEHEAAQLRADQVVAYLTEVHGWPAPVWIGSSGNGGVLLYRIDLDPEDKPLVVHVLRTLDDQFSDASVKVDTAVSNAAQLVRVAGTINAKAPTPQPDRPWRMVDGMSPAGSGVVTRGMLEDVAALHEPQPTSSIVPFAQRGASSTRGAIDVPTLLRERGLTYEERDQPYARVYEFNPCVFFPDHGAAILQFANGAVAYTCHHDRCRDKRWADAKPLLGLTTPFAPPIGGADLVPWEEPIPFEQTYGPPFPVEALPPMLREYVEAVAKDTGAPVDVVAWACLGVVGAATRGGYVISPKASWREAVHIQAVQVLASGGGKTPTYQAVAAPLYQWDTQEEEKAKEARIKWQAKAQDLIAQEKRARQEAARPGATEEQQLAITAIHLDIAAHDAAKPYAKRIVGNDATPQAMWAVMHRQGGSAAAISAEGVFLRNTIRYSDAPNFDPIIQGFGGEGHVTDRARDDGDGKRIARPILAMSLAIQPQVLEDMGKLRRFKEIGVAARLLFSVPQPRVRPKGITESVPNLLQVWWEQRLLAIAIRAPETTVDPGVLTLSPEAWDAFEAEYNWSIDAKEDGRFEDMEEWGEKYCGEVLRVAGTLHVFEEDDPVKQPVSLLEMERAITIMRHAIEHARIAHAIMFGLGAQRDERYVLEIIMELRSTRQGGVVTSAQVSDKTRARVRFRQPKQTLKVLRSLEEHRYIRLTRREGPGLESYTIDVNPRYRHTPAKLRNSGPNPVDQEDSAA